MMTTAKPKPSAAAGNSTGGSPGGSLLTMVSFLLGAAMAAACILVLFSGSSGTDGELSSAWVASTNATIREVTGDAAASAAAGNGDAAVDSRRKEIAAQYGDLEEVLRSAATKDNTIILTAVNDAWTNPGSLLDLFIESFHSGENIDHMLNHLVVVSVDKNAHRKCKLVHQHCYFLRPSAASSNYSKEQVFMTESYIDMMWARNRFQQTVLELGFNFLFSDVDVMWFRNPFRHIAVAAEIAIATDFYNGNPYDLMNFPNGGFLYVRSSNKTLEFYRLWQAARPKFPGKHEQDVFNLIKFEAVEKLRLTVQFMDSAHISSFCELSKDLNKVCTLHSNCCVGLGAKLHDLRRVLEDWRNYTAGTPEERRFGKFQWRVPGICIH